MEVQTLASPCDVLGTRAAGTSCAWHSSLADKALKLLLEFSQRVLHGDASQVVNAPGGECWRHKPRCVREL